MLPKLESIDHVHVYVKDRAKAACWYRDHLGFEIHPKYEFWADDIAGPLTLTDASDSIHLALFQRRDFTPASTIAFRVDGNNFVAWKTQLEKKELLLRCSDHTVSWSLYFQDPDGNSHEITTYDHSVVAKQLSES